VKTQAQEKLNEAKQNDPEVEARMTKVEKTDRPADNQHFNVSQVQPAHTSEAKQTSAQRCCRFQHNC